MRGSPGIWLILVPQQHKLGQLVVVTHSAQGRAGVPTKAHTPMATLELLPAWLPTRPPGTVLSTLLIACVVFATPLTLLSAPCLACVMFAVPLTISSTFLVAFLMPVDPLTLLSASLLAPLVFAAHLTLFLRA